MHHGSCSADTIHPCSELEALMLGREQAGRSSNGEQVAGVHFQRASVQKEGACLANNAARPCLFLGSIHSATPPRKFCTLYLQADGHAGTRAT